MPGTLWHYTDKAGYDSIRSQPVWRFRAQKPPGRHETGAYFTNLRPDAKHLATTLRVPARKVQYCFCFLDLSDLRRLEGDRGAYALYSAGDYLVARNRQLYSGLREDWVAGEEQP